MTKPTKTNETTPVINDKALYVPFNKLKRSANNIRTVDTDNADDKGLIENIKAVGLLQNLVVILAKKDIYEVPAGGRRFGAIEHLVKEGFYKKDHPVLCNVIDDEIASLASYSENDQRCDMHPFDIFMGIKILKDEGMSIDEIALKLAKPKTYITQLLGLGKVHETILKAYKNDDIDLSCVKAFTLSTDKDEQLAVFEANKSNLHAHMVRNHFTNNTIAKDSNIAKFVGIRAYRAKGGTERTDLFDSKGVFLNNPELMVELATAKLEKEAEKLVSEKWGWVDIKTDNSYFYDYDKTPTFPTEVPKKLLKSIEDLKSKHKTIDEKWDAEIALAEKDGKELSDKKDENYQGQLDDIEMKIEELEDEAEKYFVFDEIAKPFSGAVVFIRDGKTAIERGLMNRSDLAKYHSFIASDDDNKTVESAKANSSISQVLQDILRTEDTQLSQLALLQNPVIAFNAIAFELCYGVLQDSGYWSRCFEASMTDRVNTDQELISTDAYKAMEKISGKINRKWLKESVRQSYVEFCKLEQSEKIELMGLCSAHAITANKQGKADTEASIYAELLKQTSFKKHDFWNTTEARYFKKLNLDQLHKIAGIELGKQWLDKYESLSKKDFSTAIYKAFSTGKDLSDKVKNDLSKYIPEIMR